MTRAYKFLLRYSEIGLKGKQVFRFEQFLKDNIRQSLERFLSIDKQKIQLHFFQKQGELKIEVKRGEKFETRILEILGKIPGLAWFGSVKTLKPTKLTLTSYTQTLVKAIAKFKDGPIKLEIKRYNKALPFNSQDLFIALAKKSNISNKDFTKVIRILLKETKIELVEYRKGIGGLPVGATGRGIVLLSGGIDSPVAAFLVAKRGIAFDLLHFYPEEATEDKLEKIYKLAQKLAYYNPRARLFLAPTTYLKAWMKHQKLNYKMVIFKRFMLKVALEKALKLYRGKDFALILGDSLGQVASQTLSNVFAINKAVCDKAVILRPLVAYNKTEIIDIAKKIGTYNISILPYQDFCTGLATGTTTRTNLEKLKAFEKNMPVSIIENTVNSIRQVEYGI